MPSCSAFNCTNRSEKGVKKTFHKFPFRDPELLKEWVRRSGRGPDWVPSKRAVLCCDHFHETCFDRTGQTTRIRERAIPTIFTFTISKNGKVRDIPKSGTLSYLAKASEIAEQSTKEVFLEPKDLGRSNANSNIIIPKVEPCFNETDSQKSVESMIASGKRSQKNTPMNKFTHDHTYTVVCNSKDVKKKLDVIHAQMELLAKKIKVANANTKSLTAKEKNLIQEIKKLKEKQKADLMRIEEISDSLHFGLS